MDPIDLTGWIAWQGLPGVGARTLRALVLHSQESRTGLGALWRQPARDVTPWVRLTRKTLEAWECSREARWTRAAEQAERAVEWGVGLVSPHDPGAPIAVRRVDAPVLTVCGAVELLESPMVAILNSRSADRRHLTVTDALADALARRDLTLVASPSRPGYQASAVAAKRHAAPVVLVLDRGFAAVFPHGPVRDPVAAARIWDASFDPEHQLALSPFGWLDEWTPRAGPARDEAVTALAGALVVGDVRPGGNVDALCRRAHLAGRPVFRVRLEDETGAESPEWGVRLPWKGAESAAELLLDTLGIDRTVDGLARRRRAWDEELFRFMVQVVSPGGCGASGRLGVHPASGSIATAVRRWDVRAAGTGDAGAVVADFRTESPQALSNLLRRLPDGGILVALLPAGWMEDPSLEVVRHEWLAEGHIRLLVRLPAFSGGAHTAPGAVVVYVRTVHQGEPVRLLSPAEATMGLFHLRRYLREVTRSLSA